MLPKNPEYHDQQRPKYLFLGAEVPRSSFRLHPQDVVSEILSGKRKLTLRQVEARGKRLTLSPAVFIDDE